MAVSTHANRHLSFLLLYCVVPYIQNACAQTGYVYQLDTEFSGANFFEGWDFFTAGDPTGGFVTYYSQSSAQLTGLINATANSPTYIGADYTNIIPVNGAGRPSVRISTQKSWTHGLFIGDFNHAPGGICGTWPAFWTLGPNWPYNGEIDILEGVNQLTQNAVSLHTNMTCTIAGDANTETGILQGANCAYYPPGGNTQGCGVLDSRNTSYGTGFNNAGGGVYAMQWTSDYIRVWVFLRNQIPADITNLSPNPSGWGLPAANMQGSCPIDEHFQQHKIIFDNTFCGSYAGVASVWNSTINSCATSTGYSTCNAFVATVPNAFQNAYWSINSVRVYQLQANGVNSSTTPYIASLQPTSSVAASTSTTSAPTPTVSLCPTYNFTVVQLGAFQYEIECGYNPAGSDLGPPYASYQVHTFEDCVAGCSYWNTYNASNICGAVAYKIGGACYWKRRTGTIATDSTYNGARLIYYAYPQVTDNPNIASASSSAATTFLQTPVTPQTYSNPSVTQSQSILVSASGASSVVGMGMGGSVSRTYTFTSAPSSSQSSSSFALYSAETTSASSTFMATSTSTTANTTTKQVATTSSSQGAAIGSSSNAINTPSSTSHSSSAIVVISSLATLQISLTTPLSTSSLVALSTSMLPNTSSSIPQSLSATPQRSSTSATASFTATALSIVSLSNTVISQTITVSSLSNSVPFSYSSSSLSPPASTVVEPSPNNGLPSGANGDATLTAAPTEVITPTGQPAAVDGFRYGGCQGSSSGLTGFYVVEDSSVMSIEQCVSDCYNSAYAGLFTTSCYCGDSVDAAANLMLLPDSECNASCPGNPAELCGGLISGQSGAFDRRQASGMGGAGEILLTIYENEALVPAPAGSSPSSSAAPSLTTIEPSATTSSTTTATPPITLTIIGAISVSLSSVLPVAPTPSFSTGVSTTTSSYSLNYTTLVQPPAFSSPTSGFSSYSAAGSIGFGVDPSADNIGTSTIPGFSLPTLPPSSGYPSLLPIIVSTVWIEVCDVCEHGTTELATTVTVLHCGCTQSMDMAGSIVTVPPPCVPMTVTVEEYGCGAHGASSSTTLTVPCTSAIADASSSVAAAMAVWTTQLGTQCPTPIAWSSQAIAAATTGRPAQIQPIETGAATATPARSADLLEMTSSIAPAAGIHATDNSTYVAGPVHPVWTQTVTLDSTHSTLSAAVEGSLASPVAPTAAIATKSTAAERPGFVVSVGAALMAGFVVYEILDMGWYTGFWVWIL